MLYRVEEYVRQSPLGGIGAAPSYIYDINSNTNGGCNRWEEVSANKVVVLNEPTSHDLVLRSIRKGSHSCQAKYRKGFTNVGWNIHSRPAENL